VTMTPHDVSHFTYRVTWSAEDGEFVATCVEFPSLSWLAPTQHHALSGMTELVEQVVADLTARGEDVPQPLADRHFSGKFNLRLGAQLHRQMALCAAEEGLSLNQYVVRKLTAT